MVLFRAGRGDEGFAERPSGGMIANNSSGAHARAPRDHGGSRFRRTRYIVLAGEKFAKLSPRTAIHFRNSATSSRISSNLIPSLIEEKFPAGLVKRNWPGYRVGSCCLREPGNLINILCGSEGTLAAIIGAELKDCMPLPQGEGAGSTVF